jgi:methyltransferase (TIGR00027 family)
MTDDADWDIATGIGTTALTVAAFRAIESCRQPPLVRDPYAEAFVLASGVALPTTPEAADGDPAFPWSVFTPYIGVRSRFFDEFCATASAAGIRQVVILGAGLDTRAFRLDWPERTTVYEVDAPLVLGFKDQVLASRAAQPRCLRHTVTANLREAWLPELLATGFSLSRPTAWLAEGLLPYLTDDGRASLLTAITNLSAPGSQVAIENPTEGNASMRDYSAIQEAADQKGVDLDAAAIWADDPTDDPAGWLASHGWSVTVRPAREVAEQYGRPLSPDLPATMLSAILVTATLT